MKYEKGRLPIILSFVAGLVFFFGFCYSVAAGGLIIFFGALQKITVQSNLFAFFVTTAYLKNPKHKIFQDNRLFILSGSLLLTAGIGFWMLLFPIYFVDLSEYLINNDEAKYLSKNMILFFLFWNHLFTQIFYLSMLKTIFRRSNKWTAFPVRYSEALRAYKIYWIFILVLYIIYSYIDKVHPAYGVLSNFNWSTQYKTKLGSPKFNLKILITAFLTVTMISLTCLSYLFWISVKLNPITFSERNLKIFNNQN